MSRYIVDVLVVFEKIYVSRSKCRRSYWYQLRIYLFSESNFGKNVIYNELQQLSVTPRPCGSVSNSMRNAECGNLANCKVRNIARTGIIG